MNKTPNQKSKLKIVIMEPLGISDDAFKALTMLLKADGHQIIAYDHKAETEEILAERVADANIIVLANQPLRKKVLEHCHHLKMVDVAFTGVDHIDVDYLKANHIAICNAANYSTHAVAELAIGLMIDLKRKISESQDILVQGKSKFPIGSELCGQTLGIVGTGTIGLQVAKIAKAFGCHLIAYSRTQREEAQAMGIEYVSLDQLMRRSDIISLHVPWTKETTQMIDAQQINKMKKEAILINTARGALIDYHALAQALNMGKIAGAGIDVFEEEPPLPPDHPLLTAKNCIITPHIAYATREALYKRAEIVFDNIRCWLEGQPQNII
ncbi:NAD(P)-dependent oxidoreductase [Pseudoramibacter porci]|uniref:Hydroxyacid dehydrogenase n=1 Tax=Pseudoramibacter porci TaxID=2606631 RepID=A0A7X2NGH2_9FIRM|nr:NAD(P)-dependent oxidoreductase [Pseudoramibacter porci]MSS19678.1 hydroxyacid dehydrogenase [Pseudoramibacter porci]